MVKSLSLVAFARVSANQGCVDSWCSVTRNATALNSTFDKVDFDGCLNLCLLRDDFVCQGFSLTPVDSPVGVCTHYVFDDNGNATEVFSHFPVVNLTKVLPPSAYNYKQIGVPMTVTGLDQCRDALRVSSANATFANFGNEACGTEPTNTATVVDGRFVETEVIVNLKYDPKVVGLGSGHTGYLTLTSHGLALKPTIEPASDWTWSLGGVRQISNGNAVCFSALEADLTPVYVGNDAQSPCAMGQRGGSPDGASPFGWVMKDSSLGDYKCMGDVTPKGKYDLIAIEKPKDGLCNKHWQVKAKNIVGDSHSALTSRKCDVGAFDGAWVDGQLYPTGDFSTEWFDKLTLNSTDGQLLAHTKQGDANLPFPISISGCSITVHLRDGCDACIATGTLSEGGDAINWNSGFNDGDYWIRKNHGCCTLFDAELKTGPSALAAPVSKSSSSPEDLACAKQFSEGRWVDRSKGDFAFGWVPYMDLSSDPIEDDANGRMTAPIEQGSWVLPANFFADDSVCKIKLCLKKPCAGESYSIGVLKADEIQWDERLNHGKWDRLEPSDVCNQADSAYECCDMKGKIGCVFSPNVEVCTQQQGQFCCDPTDPFAQCGFEPVATSTMV